MKVNAQQASTIIDRLIGFKLSPCYGNILKPLESGLSVDIHIFIKIY